MRIAFKENFNLERENQIFWDKSYSWFGKWGPSVSGKLNVVIWPVKPVCHWRQPPGGLKYTNWVWNYRLVLTKILTHNLFHMGFELL